MTFNIKAKCAVWGVFPLDKMKPTQSSDILCSWLMSLIINLIHQVTLHLMKCHVDLLLKLITVPKLASGNSCVITWQPGANKERFNCVMGNILPSTSDEKNKCIRHSLRIENHKPPVKYVQKKQNTLVATSVRNWTGNIICPSWHWKFWAI